MVNHYRHHIGDYRRDTAHLTLLEHGVYRQAMDQYYLTEQPLPLDRSRLMRSLCVRNADEEEALCVVLEEFFFETDDGWRHKRCDEELEAIYAKSSKARESAEKRWAKKKQGLSSSKKPEKGEDANAMRTHSERNANGMLPSNPVPSNPTPPNPPEGGAPSSAEADSPPPVFEIQATRNEIVPISQQEIDQWAEAYPAVDVPGEIRKAIVWQDANPTNRKTKTGMRKFLNSWLSRAQDRAPRNGAITHGQRTDSRIGTPEEPGISPAERSRRLIAAQRHARGAEPFG